MTGLLHSVGDVAAFIVIARLQTFRRTYHYYRRGVSIIAWLLVALCTGTLAYRGTPCLISWPIAGLLTALAIALLRTGGNLAPLLPHRRHS
ncbi:hypothetical protein R84981_001197 [Carnimonas sp. R-84981]|uniref:phage holin family protein n=1 Tax=Carnimonas bestiolae TaxID=3402172 RepID=UPI003EDC4436